MKMSVIQIPYSKHTAENPPSTECFVGKFRNPTTFYCQEYEKRVKMSKVGGGIKGLLGSLRIINNCIIDTYT